MRIALISDLHMEFAASQPVRLEQDVDVLVLAGDIDRPGRVVNTAIEIAHNYAKHIVFVAGNHEFYGERHDKAIARMKRDAAEVSYYQPIHFLDDSFVDIEGVRFAGGTLWTDYNLDGNPTLDMIRAESYMNDHRRIKWKESETVYRRFLPMDARRLHLATRMFLADQALQVAMQPTVFVTHHAPSRLSVHEKYRFNEMNSAYASDLSALVNKFGPRYWFHGHMHDPVDYKLENTHVVANPRGYPNERVNPDFVYLEL